MWGTLNEAGLVGVRRSIRGLRARIHGLLGTKKLWNMRLDTLRPTRLWYPPACQWWFPGYHGSDRLVRFQDQQEWSSELLDLLLG